MTELIWNETLLLDFKAEVPGECQAFTEQDTNNKISLTTAQTSFTERNANMMHCVMS